MASQRGEGEDVPLVNDANDANDPNDANMQLADRDDPPAPAPNPNPNAQHNAEPDKDAIRESLFRLLSQVINQNTAGTAASGGVDDSILSSDSDVGAGVDTSSSKVAEADNDAMQTEEDSQPPTLKGVTVEGLRVIQERELSPVEFAPSTETSSSGNPSMSSLPKRVSLEEALSTLETFAGQYVGEANGILIHARVTSPLILIETMDSYLKEKGLEPTDVKWYLPLQSEFNYADHGTPTDAQVDALTTSLRRCLPAMSKLAHRACSFRLRTVPLANPSPVLFNDDLMRMFLLAMADKGVDVDYVFNDTIDYLTRAVVQNSGMLSNLRKKVENPAEWCTKIMTQCNVNLYSARTTLQKGLDKAFVKLTSKVVENTFEQLPRYNPDPDANLRFRGHVLVNAAVTLFYCSHFYESVYANDLACKIFYRCFDQEIDNVARCHFNSALSMEDIGHEAEAVRRFRVALACYRKSRGEDDDMIALAASHIADRLGDSPLHRGEAIAALQDMLRVRRLQARQDLVSRALSKLWKLCFQDGRIELAKQYVEELSQYDDNTADYVLDRMDLALFEGDFKLVEQLFDVAAGMLRRQADGNRQVQETLDKAFFRLSRAHEGLGDLSTAKSVCKRAIEELSAAEDNGPANQEESKTTYVRWQLGRLHLLGHEWNQAIQVLRDVRARVLKDLGELDMLTTEVYFDLATACHAAGQYDEAIEQYFRSASIRLRLESIETLHTALCFYNIGCCHMLTGAYIDAETLFVRCARARTFAFRRPHTQIADCLWWAAAAALKSNKTQAARQYADAAAEIDVAALKSASRLDLIAPVEARLLQARSRCHQADQDHSAALSDMAAAQAKLEALLRDSAQETGAAMAPNALLTPDGQANPVAVVMQYLSVLLDRARLAYAACQPDVVGAALKRFAVVSQAQLDTEAICPMLSSAATIARAAGFSDLAGQLDAALANAQVDGAAARSSVDDAATVADEHTPSWLSDLVFSLRKAAPLHRDECPPRSLDIRLKAAQLKAKAQVLMANGQLRHARDILSECVTLTASLVPSFAASGAADAVGASAETHAGTTRQSWMDGEINRRSIPSEALADVLLHLEAVQQLASCLDQLSLLDEETKCLQAGLLVIDATTSCLPLAMHRCRFQINLAWVLMQQGVYIKAVALLKRELDVLRGILEQRDSYEMSSLGNQLSPSGSETNPVLSATPGSIDALIHNSGQVSELHMVYGVATINLAFCQMFLGKASDVDVRQLEVSATWLSSLLGHEADLTLLAHAAHNLACCLQSGDASCLSKLDSIVDALSPKQRGSLLMVDLLVYRAAALVRCGDTSRALQDLDQAVAVGEAYCSQLLGGDNDGSLHARVERASLLRRAFKSSDGTSQFLFDLALN